MNNLVSIIIPAYNHSQYVQETIKSAINQTYQNLELIIIDDGSKDDTYKKIKELEDICNDRFVTFTAIKRDNKGTTETINELLSLSKGKYIALIASDDVYYPSAIEDQVKVLDMNDDVSLVVGRNSIIDENGIDCYWDKKHKNVYSEKRAMWKYSSDYLCFAVGVEFNSNLFGTYGLLFSCNHIPNGYVIRKSIFDKIGLFTKEAPLEDYWLMLQLTKFAKIKQIQTVTMKYRWHSANTMQQSERMNYLNSTTRNYEQQMILKNVTDDMNKEYLDFRNNFLLNAIKNENSKYVLSFYRKQYISSKTIKGYVKFCLSFVPGFSKAINIICKFLKNY